MDTIPSIVNTPCEQCGHTCPTDGHCPKCGGDPMGPGDMLCIDCDATEVVIGVEDEPVATPAGWDHV